MLTPSMLRSHLSILAAEGLVADEIIVDYADLMRPERRLGELRHELVGIYEDLRAIAAEFNVAMVTASQGNAASINAESLGMQHAAESMEKNAIMDIGIAFEQTEDMRLSGICRLHCIGGRWRRGWMGGGVHD